MSKITAVLCLASMCAFAEPESYLVKDGLITDAETNQVVEVKGGLYLSDEAYTVVKNSFNATIKQNKELTEKLKSANTKIANAEPIAYGVPVWVPVVIGAVLTAATLGVTAYAVTQK